MIFSFALAWRAVQLVHFQMVETDSSYYGAAARWFAAGLWAKALDPSWPPLYPFFISIPLRLGLPLEASGIAVSLLASAAFVFPVYLLARVVAGERVAIMAAVIAAVHPRLVIYSQSFLAESLYILLSTGALALFCYAFKLRVAGSKKPSAREHDGCLRFIRASRIMSAHAAVMPPTKLTSPKEPEEPRSSTSHSQGLSIILLIFFVTGLLLSLAFLARPEGFAYFWLLFLVASGVLIISPESIGADSAGAWKKRLLIPLVMIVGFALPAFPYLHNVYEIEGQWMVGEKAGLSFYFTYMQAYQEEGIKVATSDYASITGPDQLRKPGHYHVTDFLRRRPGTVAANTIRNIPRAIFKKIPGLMYWPLMLLSLLGLVYRRSVPRSRYELLLGAWVLLVVLMISPLFLFRRYFAVTLAPLMVWSAIGAGEVYLRISRRTFAIIAVVFVAAMMFYANHSLSRKTWPVLYKEAGFWLRENCAKPVVISGRKPEVSFYAGAQYRPLAVKRMEDLQEFMAGEGVTHLVVDDYVMQLTHPGLVGLLDPEAAPSWLHDVFSSSREKHRLVVYEVESKAED